MKRKRSPIDAIILLALGVMGILLGRAQTLQRSEGRVDPMSSWIRTILSPISTPANSASNSVAYFFRGLLSARQLEIEHRDLLALAHSAALYKETLDDLQHTVDDLRTLQKLGPVPGKVRISASVVGYAPYENRITLDVGARDGVIPGAPVESPEGLVGTVQVVETGRCQALLLTSASLTIGAIDLTRNPTPAGLLKGENSRTLTLTFQDPQAPVEVGDHIATSGFSDRIPRGIFIGKVISVTTDEEFGLRRAIIDPAVSVGELREVQVLR